MTPQSHPIEVYDSSGEPYRRAFNAFLAHTDQKANALRWLEREIAALPCRDVFIDAGAGNGKLTRVLEDRFATRIAIEPNDSLRQDLAVACPETTVIGETISRAEPGVPADFILCSHVFYYIDPAEWGATIERLASWLRPGGVLAVAIQDHETDCMRMLHHFTGERFDLSPVAEDFGKRHGVDFDVRHDLVEAHITTADLATACEIAVFMLNLIPLQTPPAADAVEAYVADHFACGTGGHRFSCHQRFLRIQRRR